MTLARPRRPTRSRSDPVEFLGVAGSTQHFHRPHFFRDTPNVLYFTVTFRYQGRPPKGGWNLETRLLVNQEAQPLGRVMPEVIHTGYEEARLEGEIPFRLRYGDRHPQFCLEIGPEDAPYATLDLGTYLHQRLEAGDMLLDLIEQGNLLRLPNDWPLIGLGDGQFTNLVPGTAMAGGSDSALVQRLAALAADRARTMGDSQLWLWQPRQQASGAPVEDRRFIVNDRFAGCAERIRRELEASHQVSFSKHSAGSVAFAYFQTEEFCDYIGDGDRALTVFGVKTRDNLEVVIDLQQLLSTQLTARLTPAHLKQLYATATPKSFHEHRLDDLNYEEFDVDYPLAEPSRLEARVQQATRSGVFLNSEPALVPFWVNFASLSLGMDIGHDPLLLSVGNAVRVIASVLQPPDRITVANLTGLLNPEFGLAAELSTEKLGLNATEAQVVNITHDPDRGFQAGDDEVLSGSVVVVTPVDTYAMQFREFLTWLEKDHNRIVGVVPVISAAAARPLLPPSWHALFVPVVRLTSGAGGRARAELNPCLQRRNR